MSLHLDWRKRKTGLVAYVVEAWRDDQGRQHRRCLRRATEADLSAPRGSLLQRNRPSVTTPSIKVVAPSLGEYLAARQPPSQAADGNGYWPDE